MAKIFREIHARSEKPDTHYVLWLEPTDKSYRFLCFKSEDHKWVPVDYKAEWSEITGMPKEFESLESLKEFINSTLVADEVGFHYDGSVPAITGLAKDLEREYAWGDETSKELLPSVDAVLEKIISKVWFEDTTVSLSPKPIRNDMYVGETFDGATVTVTIKNMHEGSNSGWSAEKTGEATLDSVDKNKSQIKIKSFTPSKSKSHGVKVTVITYDSDGKEKKLTEETAFNSYYPYYVWTSESKETRLPNNLSDYKKMLKGEFSFLFKANSQLYYNILVPYSISEATQANTNDWKNKFENNSCSYQVGVRNYYWFQTKDAVRSSSLKDINVVVKLEKYRD